MRALVGLEDQGPAGRDSVQVLEGFFLDHEHPVYRGPVQKKSSRAVTLARLRRRRGVARKKAPGRPLIETVIKFLADESSES